MALTEEQRAALGVVLEIHQEEVSEHVRAALRCIEEATRDPKAARSYLAEAQTHALLALGVRVDSLVTIVSAAALPELAPEEIELGPDLEEEG